MTAYAIDVFSFQFWNGPPPVVPTQQVLVTRRPGVSGVAQQLLGTWGETFDVALTSHFASQGDATATHKLMIALIGTGGKQLKYNDINWSALYGTVFHVNGVELVTLKLLPRIIGPSYDYTAGAELVTKWTLTPQKV